MDNRVENPEDAGEVAAERSQRKTQPAIALKFQSLLYWIDHVNEPPYNLQQQPLQVSILVVLD